MVSRCVASIVCLQLGRWPITLLIFCQLPLRNFITDDDDLNQSKINSVSSYAKFNFSFFVIHGQTMLCIIVIWQVSIYVQTLS